MPISRSLNILFDEFPQITGGKMLQLKSNPAINELLTDSRKTVAGIDAVFFAIKGIHHDGHQYVSEMYRKGCRQFVVEKEIDASNYPDANIFQIESSLQALQRLAEKRRRNFSIPVIGITGSNGKTIVKEWLYLLLSNHYSIVKNPGSYNSQLGVPLSVWQMNAQHTLGIFEAGISKPGEMVNLEKVIRPTIGIFTNLLSAHDEGFSSKQQKAEEKAKLFRNSEVVLYCKDHLEIDTALKSIKANLFSWGTSKEADVVISRQSKTKAIIAFSGKSFIIEKNFNDKASWENLFHCVTVMLYLGYPFEAIQEGIIQLKTLPMRLEMKEGVMGSIVIDDSYSNDLSGLRIALDFMNSQRKGKTIVILSDMLESGLNDKDWITKTHEILSQAHVDELIGIGTAFSQHENLISINHQVFKAVEDFLAGIDFKGLAQNTILIKGARKFRFERIVEKLQKKIHGTMMEIDLGAIVNNLNVYRSLLKPSTKIMAMVKAFAYGSGSYEVATLLQYHQVDYLGVAYADEGKALRAHGIHLPIMVMNPTTESFTALLEYKLEPSIYSISLLKQLIRTLSEADIHIKLDTGMHRLGFEENDLTELLSILKANPKARVKTIYSHLAGSDEAQHDNFSAQQFESFNRMSEVIIDSLDYPVIRHMLNSSGISRLQQYQLDMVRLGIGLYGADSASNISGKLKPAMTLRTTISQIKNIKAGETIGYGRQGRAEKDMVLGTLAIGYADGYSRAFSKGIGKILINGKLAPVVGNVCMDMTMVDITDIDAHEGDDAIIYGDDLNVAEVSRWINTIPYELLTNTSDRVKRIFFAESI